MVLFEGVTKSTTITMTTEISTRRVPALSNTMSDLNAQASSGQAEFPSSTTSKQHSNELTINSNGSTGSEPRTTSIPRTPGDASPEENGLGIPRSGSTSGSIDINTESGLIVIASIVAGGILTILCMFCCMRYKYNGILSIGKRGSRNVKRIDSL